MSISKNPKGFTLIELLIVIAILAILTTIILLVLNPVQMFAQARDSQRTYDLNTLSSTIALYLTTVTSPSLQGSGLFTCDDNYWATVEGAPEYFVGSRTLATPHGAAVDGTGWMPINFNSISGGSPLSVLPKDPINDTDYNYTYACDNTNKWFEIDAKMESERYSVNGSDDIESTDGGDQNTVGDTARYEVGNKPGLNL